MKNIIVLSLLSLALTVIPLGCSRPVKDIHPVQVTPSTLFAPIGGTVMEISQDAKGVMWFLSFDSYPELASSTLYTFDGKNWVDRGHYRELWPEGVFHDGDDNTWIFEPGFKKNALIYDGESLKQSKISIEKYSRSFTQSNLGNLWWLDNSNINRFNGKDILKIPRIPLPKEYNIFIHSAVEDNEGNYWFATSYAIWRYADSTWKQFQLPTGHGYSEFVIAYDLELDRNGTIWASTHEGLVRYNIIFEDIDGSWGEPESSIKPDPNYYTDDNIIRDSSGNLWILTRGDGVYRFDGNNWTHFTTDDGLIQNENRLGFADSKGNVWFVPVNKSGSADNVIPQYRICRFDGSDWKKLGSSDGLPVIGISSIFEDKGGDIWFGTYYDVFGSYDSGVYRFTPPTSNN